MDKSTLNYFVRFLKEERLYRSFISNYKGHGEYNHKVKLFDYLSSVEDYEALNLAFGWYYTDEGKPFWRMIHDKWNLLLRLKEKGKKLYR